MGECEPPPGAFGTAAHGPRPGSPAALADRRDERRQRRTAVAAQRASGTTAQGAPLGQQQIESPHVLTVRPKPLRLRVRSAPKRARAGRPGHARGRRAS
jgi:hypothetical protein